MKTEELVKERNKTHGYFSDNARISQSIKAVYVCQPGWDDLNDVQREALDMIALKVSRILSGNAEEKDHWHDIAGYAHLGAAG